MQAVSSVTHIEFSKVKIGFDCTMVIVSTITCLAIIHDFFHWKFLNPYCDALSDHFIKDIIQYFGKVVLHFPVNGKNRS